MLHPDGTPAKISGVHRTFLVLVLILTVIPGWRLLATLPSPEMTMVQAIPAEARPGTVVTITGYGLDAAHVQELFLLTDEDMVYHAQILRESGTSLHFRVPEKAPAGRMRIAVKTPDKAGLIEQMIYLMVLDPVG
jgi:hypothetical protein